MALQATRSTRHGNATVPTGDAHPHPAPRTHRPPLAVVEVSTDGLGVDAQPIEVAVLRLDPRSLEVVATLSTLVQPRGAVGCGRQHGLQPAQLVGAPAFEHIAHAIAGLLDGAVIIAHDLPLVRHALGRALARIGGHLEAGIGVSLLHLTRQPLATTCAELGVRLDDRHRALDRAQATAEVFRRILGCGVPVRTRPSRVTVPAVAHEAPLQPRPSSNVATAHLPVHRLVLPADDDPALSYLAMVDRYLDAGLLTPSDRLELQRYAGALGVTRRVPSLHAAYVEALACASWREAGLSPGEWSFLGGVARELGAPLPLPGPTPVGPCIRVAPGMRVGFDGSMHTGHDGTRDLRALAVLHHLIPVDVVTERSCDLVVCADLERAARDGTRAWTYGIPIMDAAAFRRQLEAR